MYFLMSSAMMCEATQPVLRHFRARDYEHPVALQAARTLAPDLGKVFLEILLTQPEPMQAERRHPSDACEQITGPTESAADGGGLIRARIVDNQEFVRLTRLGQDGMQTGWKVARFVMRADNDGNPQILRHRCAFVTERRGIPTRIGHSVMGTHDDDISGVQQ